MNEELQTLVSRLEEAGLSLERFIRLKEDKSPNEPYGWEKNLHTPDDLNGSGAYGIVGKNGLVLIDTDSPDMAELITDALPNTLKIITPRRKLPHFYYAIDGGEVPNRHLKLPNKRDGCGEIRAQNQYVVAPGSETKWGRYVILEDNPITKLTYDDFMEKVEPLLGEDTNQPLTDKEIEDGSETGTRHHYGIRMARHLIVEQKLDRDAAIHSMNAWNERNDPPMKPHDLTRMVNYMIEKHGVSAPPGPFELGGIPTGTELNDKIVSDYIMGEHSFYCNSIDPNLILYVWQGGYWQRGIYEGIVNNELSKIFSEEINRTKMQLDKTITFIRGLAMENEVQEAPPTKISFKNGLLDIKTMELGEHDKNLFIVNQIPHNYDASAECPKWLDWLGDTVPHDDVPLLQEWMGYSLYRAVPEAAFLVLTGSGQNGKTIFMDTFVELVGQRNNTAITLPSLSYDTFSRARLDQKLTNICDDLGTTEIKNAGELRKASSGSMVNAQHKFQDPFDFYPYAKIIYACNQPPEIKDQTEAIKMRLRIVSFPYVFKKDPLGGQKQARDRDELMSELKSEIPGIINWAIGGLNRFLGNNSKLSASMSTEEAWAFYRRKSLPVFSFVEECIEVTNNDADKITAEELYKNFLEWLNENNIDLKVSKRKMLIDMKEESITTSRKREDGQKSLFYGLVCNCAVLNTNLCSGDNIPQNTGTTKTAHTRTLDEEMGWNE